MNNLNSSSEIIEIFSELDYIELEDISEITQNASHTESGKWEMWIILKRHER